MRRTQHDFLAPGAQKCGCGKSSKAGPGDSHIVSVHASSRPKYKKTKKEIGLLTRSPISSPLVACCQFVVLFRSFPVPHRFLMRQPDLSLPVDLEDLDEDLVA